MGSKDKGKKEVKKQPKPKPKVEPGRKRDTWNPFANQPGKPAQES
jgi:hypothetical protein